MNGTHVVVTGASAGIGEALARAYAARGCKLTLVARRRDKLEALAASLPVATRVVELDLSDPPRAASFLPEAVAALGPVGVLVNNAGLQVVGRTHLADIDAAERSLVTNLLTPLRLIHAVLPAMIEARSGVIVNVASMAAIAPTPGMTWYNAGKGGLAAASEALRGELRGSGVNVVTVYPGIIAETDMARAALDRFSSFAVRMQPTGTCAALAEIVVRATERGTARVIWPRANLLARHFPAATRWMMDALAPLPGGLMATVTVDRDGGVAWIRYQAPENRLTAVGLLALRQTVDALVADPTVRVLVLGGADGRFLTLMDPVDGQTMAGQVPPLPPAVLAIAVRWAFRLLRRFRGLRRLLDGERQALRTAYLNTLLLADALEGSDKITIAAISGPTFGGGMELALCCDLRLAADDRHTWLALPEILAGVMVGFGSSQRLPRLIGRARALEVLLLGEPVDPARALHWGLVNQVIPADGFEAAVWETAHRLARRAPAAVAGTRRAVRDGMDRPLLDGLSVELREVIRVWRTAEAHAGLARVAGALERESTVVPRRTLPEWIAELERPQD